MSRRFQFSLRDLFWLVLVVASFLGGMTAQTELARRWEAAVGVDKRWQIPGAALTPDRRFVRIVTHPDGSNEQVEIAPVE
jgi:hypothetical protein